MTISNIYLIFWGPFEFGGPVRSHRLHVPKYGPGRSPGPMLWGRQPGAAVLWCCATDTARSGLLPSVDASAGGRHLVPLNSRRKPCPVPCWANNDGAYERRFPRWRRCCVILGDVILPPRRLVAIDVLHLCFPCFGRHPLVWLLSPYVVPSHRHCLWRVVVAWGAALGWG